MVKYYDEVPRAFFNVEKCVEQYDSLVKYVWNLALKN